MKQRMLIVQITLLICLLALVCPVLGADPSGSATYESDPTTAVNFVWVLICGFLVMSMYGYNPTK